MREPLDSHGSRCPFSRRRRRLDLPQLRGSSRCRLAPTPRLDNGPPSLRPHYRAFIATTKSSAPVLLIGTLALADLAAWTSPLASERQVLTFHTRAWSGFAPPICRMPRGQPSGYPRACPGRWVRPRFRHHLIPYDTSSTVCFRSPLRTAPAGMVSRLLLQRSPPRLLAEAACSGLRPAPDCRPRGTCPHLSYSCAPPCGPATLVTHGE